MSLELELAPVLLSLARLVLGVTVLIIARVLKSLLSPYRMDQELTTNDNPAFGLTVAGYYLASVIVFLGAVRAHVVPLDQGSAAALWALGLDFAWASGGILALSASRWVMDRALVAKACISDQIVDHRNVAAGAVEAGVYLASGLVLFGALRTWWVAAHNGRLFRLEPNRSRVVGTTVSALGGLRGCTRDPGR